MSRIDSFNLLLLHLVLLCKKYVPMDRRIEYWLVLPLPESINTISGVGELWVAAVRINPKYFSESEAITMGSRMNPECKIYIGGLPDDANKSDTHLINHYCFIFPSPYKMTPTWPWESVWIMTITPPARPYAHLSAQAFSYATPQLQSATKATTHQSSDATSTKQRIASLPSTWPSGPPQLLQKLSQSSKEPLL